MKVEIKYLDDQREFGFVADQPISPDEVIFSEKPVVCAQYLYNKRFFKACSHCLRSLEDPMEMLRRLAGLDPNEDLSATLPRISSKHKILDCQQKCGDVYCSEECRRQAWSQYHSLICPACNPHVEELEQMWSQLHFPPETATIMLLARLIAIYIQSKTGASSSSSYQSSSSSNRTDIQASSLSSEELAKLFGLEDIERSVEDKSSFKNHDFSSILQHRFFNANPEYRQQLDALRTQMSKCFRQYDDIVSPIFERYAFDRLFCLMCVNSQGIGTSALEDYTRRLIKIAQSEEPENEDSSVTPDMCEMALDTLDDLQPVIEEMSGEFTHVEGSGLYMMHSKLNHSCSPNAEIRFANNSAELQVVAIKDIDIGDEICISYLPITSGEDFEHDDEFEEMEGMQEFDEEDEMEDDCPEEDDLGVKRREILQQYYLFSCKCPKCLQQLAQLEDEPAGK